MSVQLDTKGDMMAPNAPVQAEDAAFKKENGVLEQENEMSSVVGIDHEQPQAHTDRAKDGDTIDQPLAGATDGGTTVEAKTQGGPNSKMKMFAGFFMGGIALGAIVAVLLIFVFKIFDKQKIKCDRVPYGLVDEALKGADKIDAIQANLAAIVDGDLQKTYKIGDTYQLELQSKQDLFIFVDKNTSSVGLENQLTFMRPISNAKVLRWTFGTGFILRPGNCALGLDDKYNATTVSFESIQSPRSYLAIKENSSELGLEKVEPQGGDYTCSAWSTCFVMSKSETGTYIGSVEYPG